MATARIWIDAPPTLDLMGLAGRAAAAAVPAAGRGVVATHPTSRPYGWALAAMGAVVAVAFLADRWFKDTAFDPAPAAAPAPVEGLTIFAVFFVAALALERFLEPLSKVILPADEKKDAERKKESAAQGAALEAAQDEDKLQAAQSAVGELAEAKAAREGRGSERVIVFWALATILAIVASAAMKLYFLRTVGIGGAGRVWQILATGLIVGGGTKPLHDFIAMIQAKKDASQNQAKP